MDVLSVDLGFAEECSANLLTNRYFPSKIGGKPAWLDLKNIPKPDDLKCAQCQEPMGFLCQIYAPIESDPEAFHRTIFIFVCKSVGCSKPNSAQNLKAFRSQLKRENEFYSPLPPDDDEELPAIESPNKLCDVCGCLGPMKCSQCKNAFYCSKSHQRDAWKNGHKQICGSANSTAVTSSTIVFPEFEVTIEPEPEEDKVSTSNDDDDNKETDARRQEEYENLVKEGKAGKLSEIPESDLTQYAATGDDDKVFRKFKKRIAPSSDQVLRYQRNGEPLLVTEPCFNELLTVPDCENCGSKRSFEMQIMPQMLNSLKDDSLDWGTIIVYTCSKSCNTGEKYAVEHIAKQDIIAKNENQ